jgi:hypothetical protein|tara:strand:- start:271 stop:459 length:189 start_codon:yes stop_codon:yes gene_type:complete
MERQRIIFKENGRWRVNHSDGQVTYHRTKKAASNYEHTLLVFDPFPKELELKERRKERGTLV